MTVEAGGLSVKVFADPEGINGQSVLVPGNHYLSSLEGHLSAFIYIYISYHSIVILPSKPDYNDPLCRQTRLLFCDYPVRFDCRFTGLSCLAQSTILTPGLPPQSSMT